MKLKLRYSIVILAAAAMMPIVGARGASAQDVNFTCSSGAVLFLDPTGNTNQCGRSITDHEMLNYYDPAGILVTSSSGYQYNTFQGDVTKGTAPVASTSDPSLDINSSTDLLTVELGTSTTGGMATPTGGFFQFNSVDLFASSGTVDYTIKGYDGSTLLYTITNPSSCGLTNGSVCSSSGKTVYTTIAGNSDFVTSVTIQTTDVVSGDFGHLDHIIITAPEGGAGLGFLLLAGGACFGAMGFRSRQLAV